MVHVGLDEAGAGPVYGSLWAAAVHLPEDGQKGEDWTRDSKTLSEARREKAREALLGGGACHYGLGEVTQAEIDAWKDFGHARRVVFHRALEDYVARHPEESLKPTHLTVDGTIFAPWEGVPYECVPKADASVPCVAAASILAKTTRDRQVLQWCEEHPELKERYALHKNKGYLSAEHLQGLKTFGRTDGHRATFRIKALQEY